MVNGCLGKEQIQVTVDKVRRLVDQCEGLQVKWIMEQHQDNLYFFIFPKIIQISLFGINFRLNLNISIRG